MRVWLVSAGSTPSPAKIAAEHILHKLIRRADRPPGVLDPQNQYTGTSKLVASLLVN